MNTENWQTKDYLTFVLLHMAFADEKISMSELFHLVSRLGADRVVAMRAYIESLTIDDQLKIIKKQRINFYPGEYGKSSLMVEIHELCEADGKFCNMEKNMLSILEKIM